MQISVFGPDTNPSIDKRFMRKSLSYCESEVREGRAKQVDPEDIRRGIQILPKAAKTNPVDSRGSKEQSGCLTAREAALSSEFRGKTSNVATLAGQFEYALEAHILKGRKGTPRACNVIAARVKTVLSKPTFRVTA